MKHFEINANLRTDVGKKASKKLRKENIIPCVIYGGDNTTHFSVLQSEIRKFIYTPEVMFADIKIEGKTHVSIVKDIQFHAVSDKVIHIDFYEVHPEKPVKIKIPVKVVGNCPGVKAGGKLKQNFSKLTVKGLMKNIPDIYEVNISALKIGQAIKVKDLVSDSLEFIDNKSNIIVTVISTRGAAGDAEAAAADAALEEASAE
jgi:large subunit ribosomal protein L25